MTIEEEDNDLDIFEDDEEEDDELLTDDEDSDEDAKPEGKPKKPRKKYPRNYIRKKAQAIEGKHRFLITNPNDITEEHIDKIHDYIADEYMFQETAIGLVGIDPEFFYKMMNNRTVYPLAKYAHDTLKTAEWKKEQRHLKVIQNPEQFNAKILFDFVKLTNPKLQARTRIQLKYEIALLLQTGRRVLPDEYYLKLMEGLKDNDPIGCVAELDDLLKQTT